MIAIEDPPASPDKEKQRGQVRFEHYYRDQVWVNKGMTIGDDRFKNEFEVLTCRRMKSEKYGHPAGWRKKMVLLDFYLAPFIQFVN